MYNEHQNCRPRGPRTWWAVLGRVTLPRTTYSRSYSPRQCHPGADIDFKVILLDIALRILSITATQTSRSLCIPAEVQAVATAVATLQIGSSQSTHQGKACRPANPRADA